MSNELKAIADILKDLDEDQFFEMCALWLKAYTERKAEERIEAELLTSPWTYFGMGTPMTVSSTSSRTSSSTSTPSEEESSTHPDEGTSPDSSPPSDNLG